MKQNTSWPRVRPRTRPSGTDWAVDLGMVDGKRECYHRATKAAAEELAQYYRDRRDRMGELARRLTPEMTLEAAECFDLLKDTNTSLRALVRDYVSKRTQAQGKLALSAIRDALLADLKAAGRRERTLETMNQRLGLFVGAFGSLTASQVRCQDISEWLGRQDWSLGTKAGVIRAIQQLFRYAVSHGEVAESPAKALLIPKTEGKMPEYLEPEGVGRLLTHASSYHSWMVPELAIGFFAGLRASEIKNLLWSDINFEERIITVRPEVAKTRQARHVPMSDNLYAWLNTYAAWVPSGSRLIHSPKFAAHRRKLCKELGITWPSNAMRHSYCTFHVAMFKNADLTAHNMGHRDTNMLHRHYKGLATEVQASAYWKITP